MTDTTAARKRPVHLLLPCPPPTAERAWGDYYFGQALAKALRQLGHDTYVSTRVGGRKWRHKLAHWWRERRLNVPEDAVEVAILGRPPMPPRTGRKRIIWLISNSEMQDDNALQDADHLYVASPPYVAQLKERGVAAETLLQCTEPDAFAPDMATPELASDLLFVGNRSVDEPRPIVEAAIRSPYRVTVWGILWEPLADRIDFRGIHIHNVDLGKHYASANVVLNDHRKSMLRDEFISNRVYDSLSCARPVVTEDMAGMPEEFAGGVFVYRSEAEVAEAIEAARQANPARLREISEIVRQQHSFLQRAQVISQRIAALMQV